MKEGGSSVKKKVFVIAVIIGIALFVIFYFDLLKSNCQSDECFNNAMTKCNQAKYITVRNSNYYRYDIDGSKGNDCEVKVALKKMGIGTSLQNIQRFEGKEMVCLIPKDKTQNATIDNMEGMLNYCTGPLKEAMYELMVEKLYTLAVSHMGEIVGEMSDLIKGEI